MRIYSCPKIYLYITDLVVWIKPDSFINTEALASLNGIYSWDNVFILFIIVQVQHTGPDSDEWRLVVQPVVISDAGWYSCQVSIVLDVIASLELRM